jgi:hypothetical protein
MHSPTLKTNREGWEAVGSQQHLYRLRTERPGSRTMCFFSVTMSCVAIDMTRKQARRDRRVGANTTVGVVFDGFLLVKWVGLCVAALFSMVVCVMVLCTMAESGGR